MERVLLTGATGFVGTHVYGALVAAGFDVVCGTRDPERAAAREPHRTYRALDVHVPEQVRAALRDIDAAVYLVHGMRESAGYGQRERTAAACFAQESAAAGLGRIVYLGGMRPRGSVSTHLASRLVTGEVLRAGSVPTVELQATMIVGGGSESFRIVRDLAARLPFMLLPRWLDSVSEPVAIADVATAIGFALRMPLDESAVFTVPGPERLSGVEVLLRTARLLGQKTFVVRVPFVTPRLSSYWIRLVTRANPHIATELVQGLLSDIVADDESLWTRLPAHVRVTFDDAARVALAEEDAQLTSVARLFERIMRPLARRRELLPPPSESR